MPDIQPGNEDKPHRQKLAIIMTVNRPMNIGDFNIGLLKTHGQSLQICATVDSFILTSG